MAPGKTPPPLPASIGEPLSDAATKDPRREDDLDESSPYGLRLALRMVSGWLVSCVSHMMLLIVLALIPLSTAQLSSVRLLVLPPNEIEDFEPVTELATIEPSPAELLVEDTRDPFAEDTPELLPEDIDDLPPMEEDLDGKNDAQGGAATYHGIKIYAKKIVFVIDTSSSMGQYRVRLDAAKKELAQAVGSLADDTYFTIIAYNAKPRLFNRGLVKATAADRERAVAWVMNLRWARGTNSFGALRAALAVDPDTETIMFLSDGNPTVGEIIDKQSILATIKEENAVRKVLINTIGVYTGGRRNGNFINFMKKLAEQNRGVYMEVK